MLNDCVDFEDCLQEFWQAVKDNPGLLYKLLIIWAFFLGLLIGHYSPNWLQFLWN